ncbi:multiple sugar transport system substrate-binding protein [Lentzea fradiae]|uniref:Multiple sugar transport system substrate-binding protein n=1 Tax=Lentzea fradiae TaxID=200378 RepID=A0A1G7NMX1_9PSEU|nr:ABC transporter substrate-binding protein [Lentzea fradiae]SDF75291.1 multiple sugar transport system substrate-binding protein [Lentzea fradiae]
MGTGLSRRTVLTMGAALLMTAACGTGSGGNGKIKVWHGYTDAEAAAFGKLAERWNAAHPEQQVELVFNGGNDNVLQKTLASFASGNPPEVAYQYGSSITGLTGRPQTQDLTDQVRGDAEFRWDDLFAAGREAATVDGKVYGIPALVDNLSLVYNEKLFDEAGLAHPTAEWTWDDFRSAARKLTGDGRFGWAYVNDGTEDTVWRFLALLWQAGGDLLSADGKKAALASDAGRQAMELLRDMAVTDKSVYLDAGDQQYLNLFNSGRIGMLWTGPWDLGAINEDVSYGVQILPGKVTHATIAGPDTFVVFGDNGRENALPFLKWLLSPEIHLEFAMETGHLPIRQSEVELPGYAEYEAKYPGAKVFVENLEKNVTKARPNIPQYPKISQVLGTAVQSVLLGQAEPRAALDQAAAEIDQALAAS